jgi:hypothetical protein
VLRAARPGGPRRALSATARRTLGARPPTRTAEARRSACRAQNAPARDANIVFCNNDRDFEAAEPGAIAANEAEVEAAAE